MGRRRPCQWGRGRRAHAGQTPCQCQCCLPVPLLLKSIPQTMRTRKRTRKMTSQQAQGQAVCQQHHRNRLPLCALCPRCPSPAPDPPRHPPRRHLGWREMRCLDAHGTRTRTGRHLHPSLRPHPSLPTRGHYCQCQCHCQCHLRGRRMTTALRGAVRTTTMRRAAREARSRSRCHCHWRQAPAVVPAQARAAALAWALAWAGWPPASSAPRTT